MELLKETSLKHLFTLLPYTLSSARQHKKLRYHILYILLYNEERRIIGYGTILPTTYDLNLTHPRKINIQEKRQNVQSGIREAIAEALQSNR